MKTLKTSDALTANYILGEDMVQGLVGPFESKADAKEHLKFQKQRGDAACFNGSSKIIPVDEAKKEWAWENNCVTPKKDRELRHEE